MSEQPVVLGGIIEGILVAVLGVVVASGLVPMSDALVGSILALITAAVAGITWYVNQRTTPTVKPVDEDGTPLVRATDNQPPVRAAVAGRYVVVDGPVGTSEAEARSGVRGRLVWNK